ncbi:MAG: hypothetical protein ABSF91_05890 [Bacteroidota bacterium]|jgi:hypothetical protein
MNLKIKNSIKIILPIVGLLLLIMHGFENSIGFKIDTVSAILLFFAFSPYLGSFIQKAKVGKIDLVFGKETPAESFLSILKTLSEVRMLTYYEPRDSETNLTDAHRAIVEYLMKEYKDELREELKVWLSNGSDNVRWMASEIIGYHHIRDLKDYLLPLYQLKSPDETWLEWELNCMWAHSKIDNDYKEMHNFLRSTKNIFNQTWLLGAYKQMVIKKHCVSSVFLKEVSAFLNRDPLLDGARKKGADVLSDIKKFIETESLSKQTT